MGVDYRRNTLILTHFSFWGLFMWLFAGIVFTAAGFFMPQKTGLIRNIFILAGIASLTGAFFLKKITVVFDEKTNTIKRTWQAWTGFFKKAKSIPLDKIQSIVYEREIAFATVRKTGMKQRFFLLAEVSDGSRFYFFPTTYTPHNAKENGEKIARFLSVKFKIEKTRTDSPVFRSRGKDENK